MVPLALLAVDGLALLLQLLDLQLFLDDLSGNAVFLDFELGLGKEPNVYIRDKRQREKGHHRATPV